MQLDDTVESIDHIGLVLLSRDVLHNHFLLTPFHTQILVVVKSIVFMEPTYFGFNLQPYDILEVVVEVGLCQGILQFFLIVMRL